MVRMVDPRRVGVVYEVGADIPTAVADRLIAACAAHVGSHQHQVERVEWLEAHDADHWALGCVVVAGPIVVAGRERCDAGVVAPIEIEAFRAVDVKVFHVATTTTCVLSGTMDGRTVQLPAGTRAAEILLAR